MINSLDISAFENGKNFISLGKIRPEIVSFLIEKEPSLSGQLNSETEILFWKDRLRHTELHNDDFFSNNEFYNCLERIPFIISNPDYISVHKKTIVFPSLKIFQHIYLLQFEFRLLVRFHTERCIQLQMPN